MATRHVALGEPNRVALLSADRHLFAKKRDDGGVTFVVGDEQLVGRWFQEQFRSQFRGFEGMVLGRWGVSILARGRFALATKTAMPVTRDGRNLESFGPARSELRPRLGLRRRRRRTAFGRDPRQARLFRGRRTSSGAGAPWRRGGSRGASGRRRHHRDQWGLGTRARLPGHRGKAARSRRFKRAARRVS